jgi:hypothetical protein
VQGLGRSVHAHTACMSAQDSSCVAGTVGVEGNGCTDGSRTWYLQRMAKLVKNELNF